jgi:hypothetical protein
MIVPLPILVTLVSAALAADAVLYDSDAPSAIARVSADSGRAQWDLRPVRLADLIQGEKPTVLGANQPRTTCEAPTTNAGARDAVTRAEKHIAYPEWAAAGAALAAAATALPCLGEPLEPSLATRLHFLQGVVAFTENDPQSARSAFAAALTVQPSLTWDERLPPDAKSLLDEARAAHLSLPSLTVAVGPGLDTLPSLWVDGHQQAVIDHALVLLAGEHLVQVLGPTVQTLQVVVSAATPAAIVIPDALAARPIASLLQDPSLGALLRQQYGTVGVWAWTGERTWRAAPQWEELAISPAIRAVSRQRAGRALVSSGVSLFAVGATGAVWGWVAALNEVAAVDGETPEEGQARQVRADAITPWATRSTFVAGAGLAIVGVGFVVRGPSGTHPVTTVSATVGPTQVGLTLTR